MRVTESRERRRFDRPRRGGEGLARGNGTIATRWWSGGGGFWFRRASKHNSGFGSIGCVQDDRNVASRDVYYGNNIERGIKRNTISRSLRI